MFSTSKICSLVFIVFLLGTDGKNLRKRRGIWPDVLAPGGNTFASSGYYGMQTHIAYPESGMTFNPALQGWNSYSQGFYQQNPFNNFNPLPFDQAQNPFGFYQQPFYQNFNGFYENPMFRNNLRPMSENSFRNGKSK